MLCTLVSTFLICWLPIQIFNLIIWFYDEIRHSQSQTHYYIYVITYFTCHWLSMVHTFLNPFIYCYMSNSFNVSNFPYTVYSANKCMHINVQSDV